MKQEDILALVDWLTDHGYYIGNSEVAKSLRQLADDWDD